MLLQTIIDKQNELGLTDQEFADKLGLPRSTWQLTRTRVKPLGRRVASASARAFPELKQQVVSFLLENATGVADTDPDVAIAS